MTCGQRLGEGHVLLCNKTYIGCIVKDGDIRRGQGRTGVDGISIDAGQDIIFSRSRIAGHDERRVLVLDR